MNGDEVSSSDKHYPYDVALSYAGEDRGKAETLVAALQRCGVKVFYDQNEKSTIWGKNLYIYLSDLYKNKARYCLMLLSHHYATKRWTKHELKSAQARAFIDEHEDYILPVRIDNSEIPGILETTAYLNWHTETAETITDAILAKLGKLPPSSEEIINTINSIMSNTVLILGRFTPERKAVLEAIKDELQKCMYSPILFDFEKPSSRDFTEMIRPLAHLTRFIIVDITDPSSFAQELQAIMPILTVPVQPLLQTSKQEFSMFDNFKRYPWVLPTHRYKGLDDLLKSLKERVIDPAEQKAKELAREKAKMLTSSLPNTYEPSLITQRKKALLVLAGGRALPDILALLYLRPEVVVVIMPQEGWPFQQVFADITRTLPSCEVKIIANVTAFDIDACMQACIEACLPYPDTGWDWTFTTSSSTKIMALAGYEIAKRKGIPCWQVDVLHEQVISFVRETEVDVQRFFRLTVDEYMINYGYAVDHYILRADYRDEFEACSDILRELIHSLDTPSFTTLLHDKPPGVQVPLFPATLVTSSLIQGLEACGAIKTKQKPDGTVTCEFTSKHFARFLGSGDWLEIYVWHEAKEAGFADDCQWAFQIIRGQVRFDIDLALTYKARLLIAECKTDYNPFMGKGVYLNTLDSNAHLFGGALVSKVFITNQPRTRGGFEAFHEQAKLRNIIVVTQEDLADIGAILKREVTNPTYVRI